MTMAIDNDNNDLDGDGATGDDDDNDGDGATGDDGNDDDNGDGNGVIG